MQIQQVFILAIRHLFFQFQELYLPEMSIRVVLDQGPILGFETADCTLKEGCFLSPRLLKEALAPVGIIGAEVVNDSLHPHRVTAHVQPRKFSTGSRNHNDMKGRTATVARARPPV